MTESRAAVNLAGRSIVDLPITTFTDDFFKVIINLSSLLADYERISVDLLPEASICV